ncbi:MAG: thermonuclease family protein [Patescibacteria group bacterium]|nr:thermonuclease family protein [Patescibacteria group bacterium]MDE2172801.1 thermonuclease family protein [Patescibacteria group bacterium]
MRTYFRSPYFRILIICVLVSAGIVAYLVIGAGRRQSPIIIDPDQLYPLSYVVDGDTIRVLISQRSVAVRLLGINTPETVDPRKSVECYGPEASKETKSLLAGRSVRLVQNPNREARDAYGRYLAYVYRDDSLFVNEYLISNGYAREYTVGRPYSFQSEFRSLESEARRQGKGLWGACPPPAEKASPSGGF